MILGSVLLLMVVEFYFSWDHSSMSRNCGSQQRSAHLFFSTLLVEIEDLERSVWEKRFCSKSSVSTKICSAFQSCFFGLFSFLATNDYKISWKRKKKKSQPKTWQICAYTLSPLRQWHDCVVGWSWNGNRCVIQRSVLTIPQNWKKDAGTCQSDLWYSRWISRKNHRIIEVGADFRDHKVQPSASPTESCPQTMPHIPCSEQLR